MRGAGFEPAKDYPRGLKPLPFDHSGNPAYVSLLHHTQDGFICPKYQFTLIRIVGSIGKKHQYHHHALLLVERGESQ